MAVAQVLDQVAGVQVVVNRGSSGGGSGGGSCGRNSGGVGSSDRSSDGGSIGGHSCIVVDLVAGTQVHY